MLSWNRTDDRWETDQRPETLAEQIYDEITLAAQEYDYFYADQGLRPTDPRLLRLTAYLTGLEKLLDWSE